MAERARLNIQKPETLKTRLPVIYSSMSIQSFTNGERRLEAENYLLGGFGLRLKLESLCSGQNLGALANIWQPSRLKAVLVKESVGTPFLAATQVFDARPVPRKFLALEKTSETSQRFLNPGDLVVTRSGSVGRATMINNSHEGMLISDDLLRLSIKDSNMRGWIYAYVRTRQIREIMQSSQYGHVIKHLETQHLKSIPVFLPSEEIIRRFADIFNKITDLRGSYTTLRKEVEKIYESELNIDPLSLNLGNYLTISSKQIFSKRRRFESGYYCLPNRQFEGYLVEQKIDQVYLGQVAKCEVPKRFKHIYVKEGIPYVDSADILEFNPDNKKNIAPGSINTEEYTVDKDTIIMPCSGQIYGNLGQAILSNEFFENKILSNHIMRIHPREEIDAGYLCCVLSHPTLGRPRLQSIAFGHSVPELAPEDIEDLTVPRLGKQIEDEISRLYREAAEAHGRADILERELELEAEQVIQKRLSLKDLAAKN
ncbi:hypothetical protein [Deinococcus frigens]|uniref:hypothetical protein n=1 Tax=Deinococcus frigens TaxID=249403 RepID=UPI000B093230|nr:hypothetical protein [Deinococcus frigens]